MIELATGALVALGVFFLTAASIGVLRMPDFYSRVHAPTKAATLGVMSLLLAATVWLWSAEILPRALVIVLLIGANAPVAALVLMRAAYRRGIPVHRGTRKEEYETFLAQR